MGVWKLNWMYICNICMKALLFVEAFHFTYQGTMEEKIYDRQVTKQSLANRVVDQQQIERHFTLNELTELYMFKPDLLDSSASSKSKRSMLAMPQVRTAGGLEHVES